MKKLLENYRLRLEKDKAHNTCMSYMSDLLSFLNEENITDKARLARLKSDDINEYVYLLKSRGKAYSSISRAIASLKCFFEFCAEEGIVTRNLTDKIEMPKIQRKLPNVMTSAEIEKLLEAPDITTLKGIRDKAMLEVMYATGARVSEIIGLRSGDLSLKNEMLVLSSGKKHRFVPLGRIAIESLYLYIREAREKLVNEKSGDIFFLNVYGMPLTRQGFWKILKRYIKECGIDSNVTAQTLRHSFALHLLQNGADLDSVSEMLGYNDAASGKIYLEVMNSKIKEVYKNAHPRA